MARILIVEDNSALSYDMAETLKGWGHEVGTAADGSQGFKIIKEWRPDLVLSDINMPNGTGFDLIRHIKSLDPDYAGMAFLFISALSAPKVVVEGLDIGADDYITKPVDYELLKAKLEAHLRKREAMQGIAIQESLRSGTFFAATFAGGFLVLGIMAFMIVYSFKTVLGINIFEDVHLKDFF